MTGARLIVNLLVLNDRAPGGTGYYAISLFESMAAILTERGCADRLIGIVSSGAERYFSPVVRPFLEIVPAGGPFTRIFNELVRLPLLARREQAETMLNPAFLGPLWGTPQMAVTIHDLYFRSVPHLMPLRRRYLLRLIVPLLARRSCVVLTDSRASLADIAKYYPSWIPRTKVIHCGSRLTAADDRDDVLVPAAAFVLLVGHLTANKRPEVVVEAIRRLRDQGHDVHLVHVGNDDGRLAPAAAREAVGGWVHVLGRLPDHQLASLYRQCLAVVLPSLHEGFGLPLVEAQAMGAPVIASTRGALPEVAGDSALFFDVNSGGSCAAAILGLLENSVGRADLIARGTVNAKRFSWATTASETLAALGFS